MRWKKWQVDYLEENYGEITNKDIAEFIDKSEPAVAAKAHNMGLKKTTVYLHKIRNKPQLTIALHKMFKEWDKSNRVPPIRRIPKQLSHLFN